MWRDGGGCIRGQMTGAVVVASGARRPCFWRGERKSGHGWRASALPAGMAMEAAFAGEWSLGEMAGGLTDIAVRRAGRPSWLRRASGSGRWLASGRCRPGCWGQCVGLQGDGLGGVGGVVRHWGRLLCHRSGWRLGAAVRGGGTCHRRLLCLGAGALALRGELGFGQGRVRGRLLVYFATDARRGLRVFGLGAGTLTRFAVRADLSRRAGEVLGRG